MICAPLKRCFTADLRARKFECSTHLLLNSGGFNCARRIVPIKNAGRLASMAHDLNLYKLE